MHKELTSKIGIILEGGGGIRGFQLKLENVSN